MKKGALLAIAMLVSSISASATPITTGWQTLSTGDTQFGTNVNLSFNKFDPSLGTLQAVEVKWSVTTSAGFSIQNNSSGSLNFRYRDAITSRLRTNQIGAANFSMYSAGSCLGFSCTAPSIVDQQRYVGPNGYYETPGFSSGQRSLTATASNGANGATYNSASLLNGVSVFAAFTGAAGNPGQITFFTENTRSVSANTNQNNTFLQSARYNTTVQVRYTYEPAAQIPEPTTMAGTGIALLALSISGRKFFRK